MHRPLLPYHEVAQAHMPTAVSLPFGFALLDVWPRLAAERQQAGCLKVLPAGSARVVGNANTRGQGSIPLSPRIFAPPASCATTDQKAHAGLKASCSFLERCEAAAIAQRAVDFEDRCEKLQKAMSISLQARAKQIWFYTFAPQDLNH